MYCENCGKKRQDNENFCIECGKQYYQPNLNHPPKSKNNITLILGIISCVLIPIPILAIPLAITSIIISLKNKDKSANLIPAIISLIIAIIEIIIIGLGVNFFYNTLKNNISTKDFFKENYYYETIPPPESFDIKGYDWIGDDNSVLSLKSNTTYTWYQSQTDQTNNYYQGTYEVYNGTDAISYIANNLQDYGLSEYEQRENITGSNHDIQEYYLIILNCEKMIINGTEQIPSNSKLYYYGYYNEETKYLDLTNMQTKNQAGFTLKNTIDTTEINEKYHF